MASQPVEYEVRIYYTVQTLQHIARHGVVPTSAVEVGTDFADIDVFFGDDTFASLDTVVDDLVALIQPFYGGADDIERAELWHNDIESNASTFVSAYDISLTGTGAAGSPANSIIFTMRSRTGKLVKFFLMEPNPSGSARMRPPYAAGALHDLAVHLAKADSALAGRSDVFARYPLGILIGQNEALWRKRYRP